MGQARRRKAEIAAIKADATALRMSAAGIPIVNIHEAGHAVTRFMTARLTGHEPEEAVQYIDIYDPPKILYEGNRPRAVSEGYTLGPALSKEMEDKTKHLPMEAHMLEVGRAALEAGVNVNDWAVAKIIQSVGGAVAEAMALGVPLHKSKNEHKGDFADAGNFGKVAGWSDDKIVQVANNSVEAVEAHFSKPPVWNALLTLAKALPKGGRTQGCDAWLIYYGALTEETKNAVEILQRTEGSNK